MRLTVVLLAAWEGLGRVLLDEHAATFVPLPSGILSEAVALSSDGELWGAVWHSALRVGVGGLMGVAVGVAGGVAMAAGTPGRAASAPLALLRPIPPIAWIPLTVLWFGVGEIQQAVILAGTSFHVVAVGTADAVRRVPRALVDAAKNLGATGLGVSAVRLRAALPGVATAVREGFAVAWFVLVAAEFVSATDGLGVLVLEGRDLIRPARTFVGMAGLGLAGAVTDVVLRRSTARLLRWA